MAQKTKFSLAAKNALSYFALFVITIGLVAYFILSSSSREIIRASEKNLVHVSDLVDLEFSKFLTELSYDITHISKSPLLFEYLEKRNSSTRKLLSEEYLSLLNSKPHISQIRYISADLKGQELVRVERQRSTLHIVDDSELQNKGTRDYFLNTVGLPEDSIYISIIDLNKEFGEISRPFIPTLRMAYPVYFKGTVNGIIVINTNLSELFSSLDKLTDEKTELSLVDSRGFYIFHKDKSKEFEWEFDQKSSFVDKYKGTPLELQSVSGDILDRGSELIRIARLVFPKADYDLFIQLVSQKADLLAPYYRWRNNSLLVIAGLSMMSLIIALLIMRRQVRELKNITETINKFPSQLTRIELPINRQDEIGVLADSFNRMSDMVVENIQELEQARDRAETAMHEKQEFLENMSHEIRNPIHTILGLSELLVANEHLPHQAKLIENIRLNTENLQTLVNDVLDYRKLLRNEIRLNPRWYNLSDELQRLQKIFAYNASMKRIDLRLEVDDTVRNAEYYIDIGRIRQVLTNLVSNAIKYTDTGGIVTVVLKRKSVPKKSFVRLSMSVNDNGRGISEEALSRINERYFRMDRENPAQDGFGLGLSIVVGLLKMFNSSLEIYSKPGEGSRFSFNIDVREQHGDEFKPIKKTAFGSKYLSHLDVLILEDDRQIVDLYTHSFTDEFNRATFLESPSEEKTDLGDKPYDIIISDYKFEHTTLDKSWNSVVQFLDANAILFIVTALSRDEINFNQSPFFHIQKPFKIKELIGEIETYYTKNILDKVIFESIRDDYDGDLIKYKRVLDLLSEEWERSCQNLLDGLVSKGNESVAATIHKMITTVRRLELTKLESLLNTLSTDETGNYTLYKQKIRVYMDYVLEEINKEIARIIGQ